VRARASRRGGSNGLWKGPRVFATGKSKGMSLVSYPARLSHPTLPRRRPQECELEGCVRRGEYAHQPQLPSPQQQQQRRSPGLAASEQQPQQQQQQPSPQQHVHTAPQGRTLQPAAAQHGWGAAWVGGPAPAQPGATSASAGASSLRLGGAGGQGARTAQPTVAPPPSFSFQPGSVMRQQLAAAQAVLAQAGLGQEGLPGGEGGEGEEQAGPAPHGGQSGASHLASLYHQQHQNHDHHQPYDTPSLVRRQPQHSTHATAAPPATATRVAAAAEGGLQAELAAAGWPSSTAGGGSAGGENGGGGNGGGGTAGGGSTGDLITSLVSRYTDAQAFLANLRGRPPL
jgi:hypothetical protein